MTVHTWHDDTLAVSRPVGGPREMRIFGKRLVPTRSGTGPSRRIFLGLGLEAELRVRVGEMREDSPR
jgi:hypothetical protein